MDDARREDGPRDASSQRRVRAGLNDQTQRRIGNHLRAMYDAVLQQPVPDRFSDLIARLDASEPDKA
ncbi:NepR family anti-sigma factor [Methylobacterium oxalidis]|uniref:NepR family anti-sigma factor n=1 Tax=Methylobacterium oxalidis TaxID=944322 RepID=UPI0038B31399